MKKHIMVQGVSANKLKGLLRQTKIAIYCLFCVLFMSTTCQKESEDCHMKIKIENLSQKDIYFTRSYRYPDTLTIYPNPTLDALTYHVEKKSYKNDLSRSCYENVILLQEEHKIMYFIYDYSTLNTTNWDTIVKNYMILKRFDLSVQDLKDLNWTITYP